MRAVCWEGKEKIQVETVPDPVILNPRDAIIKVTTTAICGSDLHIYDGYIPTMQKGDVLGHEFMGEVVDVGKDNTRLKIGDRVVVPFTIACGHCYFCKEQLWSLCDNSNPNAWMAEKLYRYSASGPPTTARSSRPTRWRCGAADRSVSSRSKALTSSAPSASSRSTASPKARTRILARPGGDAELRGSGRPRRAASHDRLRGDGRTLEFIKDQYRHCKPILALGESDQLLEACGIKTTLPNGDPDTGVLLASDAASVIDDFVAAMAKHRHFARETDPPRV